MSEICIILTAEQAQRDWSGSRKGTALRPMLLADGATYVLPARVVEDDAFAEHHAYLKKLVSRAVEDGEFIDTTTVEKTALMRAAPVKSK